jgi:hypothetical protein
VAGQIQFFSEASRDEESTKSPERQGPFCKTSSRTRAHIKFRELSYHTSQIDIQKECRYENNFNKPKFHSGRN